MRQLGLTQGAFFEALPDSSVRRFLDADVLGVLDSIYGGRVGGDDLRRVAETLVDLDVVIQDPQGRRLVLELIPEQKRAELEVRVERDIAPRNADGWSQPEVRRLLDFFAVGVEERIVPAAALPNEALKADYGLFDHQRQAVKDLQPLLAEGGQAVLHLPTGVGKTRTAMHVVTGFLRKHDPAVVVWLASSKELLDQAVEAFREAWSHLGDRELRLGVMQGDLEPDLDPFTDGFLAVGLAKGWAMLAGRAPDWTTRLAKRVRLVVFDEAHQSIASTYRQLTEDLRLDHRCSLLGLTATPGRSWDDIDKDGKLAEFYDHAKVTLQVSGHDPIRYLTDNGYLAKPTFRTLLSEPGVAIGDDDLARVASSLDIPEDLLARLTMSGKYVAAVLNATETLLRDGHKRVLLFAATVSLARLLAATLVARGVKGYCVTGTTAKRARAHAIGQFKSDDDEPSVLVNYGVLTTGFDAPKASAAVIARPTKSLVLYSQMVGRAIRGPRAGGTETCEVVTVVDPRLKGFGDVTEAFHNWEDVWH